MRCARCDWHHDPHDEISDVEQLAVHSLDSAHPLCIVCHRSLPPAEGEACDRCLTTARERLAGILLMFEELPTHLGHAKSPVYDSDRPSAADGAPLPGGDALVLLSPGSEGLSEDGLTTRDDDVSSVAFELGWWEQRWRKARRELLDDTPRSTSATVRSAGAYLEVHSRWACTSFDGFREFTDDLRRIHTSLESATGRSEHRLVAEAECFECGGELVREIRPRVDDGKPRRKGKAQEGVADDWTCQRCGRRYDEAHYLLALHQHLRNAPLPEWALPEHAAVKLGVNAKTIRTWAVRGHVRSQPGPDGRLRVSSSDVAERHEARQAS